ncbi:MAG: HK97 gp10 family phage protein [Syntrophomonadaceae bacterium]
MAKTVSIDQLAGEIAKELAKYSQEVVEKLNISSERVGKEAVKQLKKTSPKRPGSGKYAKSWALKTERKPGQAYKRVVHAKSPHYRLTHLLEHGHAKRGGGRVEGIPHIGPAEEMVIKEFTKEVERALKDG